MSQLKEIIEANADVNFAVKQVTTDTGRTVSFLRVPGDGLGAVGVFNAHGVYLGPVSLPSMPADVKTAFTKSGGLDGLQFLTLG